ncbi:hypothetical protein ARMGADRAFT_749667 [Armillaria gallica]|uniref:Uncharacterized protein n=1 Tax=Armillaria gallica TaxID=47427 RepID=A0A2H3E842_ARMGA|nr:hypothetical protein ARMGADRAFT_749667 [Armillaria gallica]
MLETSFGPFRKLRVVTLRLAAWLHSTSLESHIACCSYQEWISSHYSSFGEREFPSLQKCQLMKRTFPLHLTASLGWMREVVASVISVPDITLSVRDIFRCS